MKPKKGEAASRERDGLQSTQSENVVEEDYTTKGEWDLDCDLDDIQAQGSADAQTSR